VLDEVGIAEHPAADVAEAILGLHEPPALLAGLPVGASHHGLKPGFQSRPDGIHAPHGLHPLRGREQLRQPQEEILGSLHAR